MTLMQLALILVTTNLHVYGSAGSENYTTHHAFLKLEGKKSFGDECGGALIAPNYVLTAARCGADVNKIVVYLGLKDRTNATDVLQQTVLAEGIHIHPEYDECDEANDIAILELPEKVNYTKDINAIKLPHSLWDNPDIFHNRAMNATGFGSLSEDDVSQFPIHLRSRIVEKMSRQKCIEYFDDNYEDFDISDNVICTEINKNKSNEPCHDNLGSPLTLNVSDDDYLMGIETWFASTCPTDDPEVYTSVARHLNWISRITGLKIN